MDKTYPKNKYCLSWKTHAKHVFKSLCCLMEHQSLVDIAICCGNKTLHAHKCILAANSHYFQDEMERNSAVEQIVITGFHFSVLKSIIEFMYCGETIINEEDVKYLIAASKVLQIRGLDTLFSDRQEYQHLADDVYIPYPQFISSKPKYPMAYHPPSNPSISNGATLKLPSYCITDPFNKKKLKRKYLRSEAEKACAKEAHASRMALAHLQKEIASTSQVNSFIIEESCTETTVENFIPHAEEVCMESSKTIEPVQIIDYTNADQSFNSAMGNSKQNILQFGNIQNTQGFNSDKLKNIFGSESPANIEIIFKTSDGNFVTVNDEVLQNISKGGLQYQIVDENGHVGEIQDFKPLERSACETQQNLDMLKEFMKTTKISGNDSAQTVCENVTVPNEGTSTESVDVIDDKTEISTVMPDGSEMDDDRKPIQFMLLDNGDFDTSMLGPFPQTIKLCADKNFSDCAELSRQMNEEVVSDFVTEVQGEHSTNCDKSSLKFSPDIFFADSTTSSVCGEKKLISLRKT